jgi:hypothetical protein
MGKMPMPHLGGRCAGSLPPLRGLLVGMGRGPGAYATRLEDCRPFGPMGMNDGRPAAPVRTGYGRPFSDHLWR